jgi:hypothetical protein
MSGRKPSVIVDRLGADDAARLSAIVGGTRLHVPGRLANADRLKRLLGEDLAIRVVLHFGDSRFYVPVAVRSPSVDLRKLKRLIAQNLSSARIARKLGCSERTVDAKRAQLRSRARTNAPKSGE